MRVKINLVWLLAMGFCASLDAQKNVWLFSDAFLSIPEHTKIVVLGENHVRKNFIQQSDAIKYFCEVRGYKNVFFEEAGFYGNMFQDYVTGVSNELKKTLFWNSVDELSRETKALLELIRQINKGRNNQEKIQVYCYEIFDGTFEQDFRKGVLSLFPDTTQVASMPWFSVLNEDGLIQECDLFNVWWHLKTIRDDGNADQYGMSEMQWQLFLKSVLEIEIAYRMYSQNASDEILAWRRREDQLYSNIANCTELLSGSIIFCGAGHAEINGGIGKYEYLNQRFTERLKTDFNEAVCSILPQYVYIGPIDRYMDPDISYIMSYDLSKHLLKKQDYMQVIANNDLPDQAPAKGKCDYVFLVNIRKAKKVYRRHKRYGLPRMNLAFSEWYRLRTITEFYFEPDEWRFKKSCNLSPEP